MLHRHFISGMKKQDVQGRTSVLKFWPADACQLMYRLLHLLDSDQFEKIHRHIHQQEEF